MSEFKAIESQDELNRIITARLSKQKESLEKEYSEKYSDYDELKAQIIQLKSQAQTLAEEAKAKKEEQGKELAELKEKLKAYSIKDLKVKIATETGIPYSLADRLAGEDEKTIREDAEKLAPFLSSQRAPLPLKDIEPNVAEDPIENAYKELSNNLFKGE